MADKVVQLHSQEVLVLLDLRVSNSWIHVDKLLQIGPPLSRQPCKFLDEIDRRNVLSHLILLVLLWWQRKLQMFDRRLVNEVHFLIVPEQAPHFEQVLVPVFF